MRTADRRRESPVVPQLQPGAQASHNRYMKLLVDAEGREWRVYERTTGELSPAGGRRSLVFDADGIVRRLWRYPASWCALPDAELLRLMDGPLDAAGQDRHRHPGV